MTLVSWAGAKARHISAVLSCTAVRRTNVQVRPAPVTVAVVAVVPLVATNASRSSLGAAVENVGETTAPVVAVF